ncbi:hypothetical protein EXIGLDRAFT_304322 [Exidia glandulosa HHB12029]|uniref:Uncharacterized protein n=1 Tax=Exidia glandulosa HHB12029 TaxID=1314781 RepID=A0A165ZLN5_EXIGL|nr:hypothetical protein EXIGLDRAFT_304322 [Exidia glandulosa HHB12029]
MFVLLFLCVLSRRYSPCSDPRYRIRLLTPRGTRPASMALLLLVYVYFIFLSTCCVPERARPDLVATVFACPAKLTVRSRSRVPHPGQYPVQLLFSALPKCRTVLALPRYIPPRSVASGWVGTPRPRGISLLVAKRGASV